MNAADRDTRRAYVSVLAHWLHAAAPPPPALLAPEMRARLARLDAIVPGEHGLGCYPFSARDTGIHVRLPAGRVAAMCAIDALAIARLSGERMEIAAACVTCHTPIRCRVESDGSLDHDQTGLARVVWLTAGAPATSCSEGVCRALHFLCPQCTAAAGSDVFTLPQAAAIGNAFFGFQRALLRSETVVTA